MGHGDRFRRKALKRGYKVDEVDGFLDRAEATLARRVKGEGVTASDVRDVVFRTRFGGYDEWQVDLHLDRLEKELEEMAAGLPPRGSNGFRALEAGPSAYREPATGGFAAARDPAPAFAGRDERAAFAEQTTYDRPVYRDEPVAAGYRDDTVAAGYRDDTVAAGYAREYPPEYDRGYRDEPVTAGYAAGPARDFRSEPGYDRNGYDPRIADPRIADPRIADPRIADPRIADPRIADPRIADPRIADPRIADPRIADPRIADPRIADPRAGDDRAGYERGAPDRNGYRDERVYAGDAAYPRDVDPRREADLRREPAEYRVSTGYRSDAPYGSERGYRDPETTGSAPLGGAPSGLAGAGPSGPPGPAVPVTAAAPPRGAGPYGREPQAEPQSRSLLFGESFRDTLPPPRPLDPDGYGERRGGRADATVEFPSVGGGTISPFTNEDKSVVSETRASFRPRRFGSGYDPAQVERLFDAVQATMDGRGAAAVTSDDLAPGQFALVQGGYFEDDVDGALREVRQLFSRRMGG